MKIIATCVLLCFLSCLNAFGQQSDLSVDENQSKRGSNFVISLGLGFNMNHNYPVDDNSAGNDLFWGNYKFRMAHHGRILDYGLEYENPILRFSPPLKVLHNIQFVLKGNFVALFGKEHSKKWFIGPSIYVGKTTGYQIKFNNPKFIFDDQISGLGFAVSYRHSDQLCFFADYYHITFYDAYVNTSPITREEFHQTNNFALGIGIYPITLIKEKRLKTKH